ncbi:MAG: type II secretion system minor pseudopilin GspJ [Gammaproteobacteria bacterium]|nr:type II secretion system minor pseudopilin GspJ [Gammaproteobacteria bacterium]
MIMRARRNRGFTLIEMLVAVAIFGVVATLAYGGLSAISQQAELTDQRLQRLAEIRRGLIILERDLLQAVPRQVRHSYQNQLDPALAGGALGVMDLVFTRGGWRNPTNLPRSTLQRVAWAFDGGTLYRFQWPVLDAAPGTEPQRVAVIEDVEGFAIRFRDNASEWHEQWPTLDASMARTGNELPLAIEFTLDLGDAGRIRRVVELSGWQGNLGGGNAEGPGTPGPGTPPDDEGGS